MIAPCPIWLSAPKPDGAFDDRHVIARSCAAPISTSGPMQAEGADFHVLGETGVGIDQCGRMNLHSTPASLKLK